MYRWTLAALLLPSLAFGQAKAPPGVVTGNVGGEAFKSTGGSAARTLADRAGDRLNVKDFGAKGDCSTDDSAAIAAAIASSATPSVYFPRPPGGCYMVSTPIVLPNTHNFTMTGDGRGVSVIRAKTAIAAVFQKGTGYMYGGEITGLTLDGNGLATYVLDLQAGRGIDVHDAEIINPVTANIRIGDGTNKAYEMMVHHNAMVNTAALYTPNTALALPTYNVQINALATDNQITDNIAANAATANFYDGANGGNNFFLQNHAYGYPAAQRAAYCYQTLGGTQLVNNEADGCTTYGFKVDGGGVNIVGGVVQDPFSAPTAGVVIASGATKVIVSGMRFSTNVASATAIVQTGTAGAGTYVYGNSGADYATLGLMLGGVLNHSDATTLGAYAVSLQWDPASYTGAVPKGDRSNILGGKDNENRCPYGIIAGGQSNFLGSTNASCYSYALGSNNASNIQYNGLSGWNGSGLHILEFTRSFDKFATQGDRQEITAVLYSATTTATATRLKGDANAASSYNTLGLSDFQSMWFSIDALCRNSSTGDKAAWFLQRELIHRESGAASTAIMASPTTWDKTRASSGAAAWTLTYAADTTLGGLNITFTGQASSNIHCAAKVSGHLVIQ